MSKPKMSRTDAAKKPKQDSAAKKSPKPKLTVPEEKKSRAFRLTADAHEVLKAVKESKKQHGLRSLDAFVALAICDFGKKLLGDDCPVLREAPAEYLAERLAYLEREMVEKAWKRLGHSRAKRLYEMVKELELNPYNVDMGKAQAWATKKKLKGLPKKQQIITAALAVRFKLSLPQKKDTSE